MIKDDICYETCCLPVELLNNVCTPVNDMEWLSSLSSSFKGSEYNNWGGPNVWWIIQECDRPVWLYKAGL